MNDWNEEKMEDDVKSKVIKKIIFLKNKRKTDKCKYKIIERIKMKQYKFISYRKSRKHIWQVLDNERRNYFIKWVKSNDLRDRNNETL